MSHRLSTSIVLAFVVLGCSGAANTPAVAPDVVPSAVPGAATPAPPGAATPAPPAPAGDVEAKARALIPPGSTETGALEAGGQYAIYLTTTTPLDQLEAFWDQAIPAQGMTIAGKYTVEGILTIAITNPDGGIVATPDPSGGGTAVSISLGLSS